MGKTGKGILDQFSGKIGTVVGATWKGKGVMRSVPRQKKNRKFSPEQLDQQAKFKAVGEHVQAMSDFIARTFTHGNKKQTAFNTAMQEAIANSLTGTYPDYAIDWSKLKLSNGKLLPAMTSSAVANGTDIQFTWSTETPPKGNPRDKVLMVVYCPALQSCNWDIASSRSAGTAIVPADYFAGQVVHTYIGFVTEKGDRSSVSRYTGQLTL